MEAKGKTSQHAPIGALTLSMRPWVRGWIYKTQPHRRDQEDLEAAVLLALLEAETRFTGPPEAWPGYAWPRIRGTVFDEIRKTHPFGFRRHHYDEMPTVGPIDIPDRRGRVIAELIPDHAASIEHDPVAEQNLKYAVAALCTDHRIIVDLLVESGWTLAEVAPVLGITPSAVWHARNRIKKELVISLAHPMARRKALQLLHSESFLRQQIKLGLRAKYIAGELGVSQLSVIEQMKIYRIVYKF